MNGELYAYFFDDHRELEEDLKKSAEGSSIDMVPFTRFREGLLRHIGMEERILLPTLEKHGPESLRPTLKQIHLDHGAIAALLVPLPTHAIVRMIEHILEKHNVFEEAEGGMYDACENLTKDVVDQMLKQARETPPVKVNKHNPSPFALEAMKRAVERAGYDWKKISNLN